MNPLDEAAREHDFAYQAIQNQGINPYINYNQADKDFQKRIQGDTSLPGNLARIFFHLKSKVAPDISDPSEQVDAKEEGEDPAPTAETLLPAPANTASTGGTASTGPEGQPGEEPPKKRRRLQRKRGRLITMSDMSADAPIPTSIRAGDPGPANAWTNSASWGNGTVTTRATRTWVCPAYNNHLYKSLQLKFTNSDINTGPKSHFGWSTPWAYFDFNRFHCLWSPRDWQRLVNNNTGFRPKSLKVSVFNVQIKEVSTIQNTKQILTSTGGTVQILEDKRHTLPYVLSSCTTGAFSPFPNDITILPQYAYVSMHELGEPTQDTAFFCLEGMDSAILGNGDSYEYIYYFPALPFHSAYQINQFLHQTANPLLDQYLWMVTGTDNQGQPTWGRPQKADYMHHYQNWLYGPQWQVQMMQMSTQNYKNLSQAQWDQSNPRVQLFNQGLLPIKPGVPGFSGSTTNVSAPNNTIYYDVSDSRQKAGSTIGTTGPDNTRGTPVGIDMAHEGEVRTTNLPAAPQVFYPSGSNATVATATATAMKNAQQGSTDQLHYLGTYPGMMWMNRDMYLQGPIWAKIPNTDGKFHPAPHMGGFGMSNPPPQLLIKVTPTPADPPSTYQEKTMTSFLTQYASGQITYEIEWEVVSSHSERWNPQEQWSYTSAAAQNNFFWVDANGLYREGQVVGSRWISQHL